MPNIRSAAKRMRADAKKKLHNLAVKSELKTLTRQFREALQAGQADQARTSYQLLVKRLDQAAGRHILPRNTASRRKARFALRLARI